MPRRRLTLVLTLLAFVVSCKFPELPPLDEDAVTDAISPDVPTGPAVVSTPQGPHDFGQVVIGRQSPLLQVAIRNSGGETTGPLSVALLGVLPEEFDIVPTGDSTDCVNARLVGGAECTAQVRYAPSANVTASARLEVSGSPGGTATVVLTGDALTPARLSSTTTGHDFGDIVTGQPSTLLQVVVRNDGEELSGALSVTLGGAHPGDFTVVTTGTSNDCAGSTLGLEETCIAQVRFQPTLAATRTADLLVNGLPGGAVTVPLTGDGLAPGNLVVEMPSGGAPLDLGTRELGTGATSATQTIRVRNSGGAPTGLLDVTLTGGGATSFSAPIDNCDGNTLEGAATCEIQIRFNPVAVGTQPATVTIRDTVAMTAASVSATGVGSARVAVNKTGLGAVVSNPTGVNCDTGCSTQTQSFSQTPISLTATAEPGWVFSNWSGSCSASNPSSVCSLTLDQGLENVGVLFTQVFVLSVTTTGSGTVTSASPGILCGNANTDCSEPYPVGTMVQLDAEPDVGWEIFAWTGTGVTCGLGTRSCTVTMNQARNVAVTFRRTFTLSVAVTGSGQGTVSGTFPGGSINCATGTTGTCSSTVIDGTNVTLTESPGTAGSGSQIIFGGWGNDCSTSGTMTMCTLAINASKSVGAAFSLQHRISLSLTGTGAGTVTANPGNFTCSSGTCTRYYDADTDLTITATPASSLDGFTSFTGDCTTNPCSILDLSSPKATTASFTRFQCVPTTESCTSGRYTQCSASGTYVSHMIPNGAADGSATTITMNMYQCPMGCHTSQPRCADINASNGLNNALDAPTTSATGMDLILPRTASVPAGIIVINTDTFDTGTNETTITDADGVTIRVPARIVTQTAGSPPILVLQVRSFTIRSGRTVEVRGTRALGIASHFDIYIAGILDLSTEISVGRRVSPGSITWSGGCSGGVSNGVFSGAGNATQGGNGSNGVTGGLPRFDTGLSPLQGGCDGGNGSTGLGIGGGAVQLASRTRIAMSGTARIDVSGGGGDTAFAGTYYVSSGGGSGGGILFEAPVVTIAPGATLTGRGGSGAASSSGSVNFANGIEGPTSGAVGAAQVTCSGCGTSGRGGTETTAPGNAAMTTAPVSAGGGGAAGRCATRTASGSFVPPTGSMLLRYEPSLTLSPRSPP